MLRRARERSESFWRIAVEGRHHILFLVSLVTLLILGAWWTILFHQNVDEIYGRSLENLRLQTRLAALEAQVMSGPRAPRGSELEVVPAGTMPPTGFDESLAPRWPELAIRPRPEVIANLQVHHRRKVIQVFGEGALLMILIFISMAMLYYMVLVEGRVRRSMENFLSTVTHELKTPIAGMKALLQTLSARSIPEEKRKHFLEMGLRESARLQHLVDNVLVANRLNRKRMQINVQAVDLLPLLHKEVESRRQLFATARELTLSCDDGVVVAADPEALGIVIENILDNALKYSAQEPRVEVVVERSGGDVSISVVDNGIGMDDDDMTHIFDRFHRATQNGIKAVKGSGLGLYIARNLARAIGGDLVASSAGRGRGSTFTVRLRAWQ